MNTDIHNQRGPGFELSNSQLVRNVLAFLASHHPKIKADDVAALPDDLLDWNKLVEVDFLREWQESITSMRQDSLECIRASGKAREDRLAGARSLFVLFEQAKTSEEAFGDLQCAAILIGNLIEDAIGNSNPQLARVIQMQVNSFWNASANQALSEADFGGLRIAAILPEHSPRAPELDAEGAG